MCQYVFFIQLLKWSEIETPFKNCMNKARNFSKVYMVVRRCLEYVWPILDLFFPAKSRNSLRPSLWRIFLYIFLFHFFSRDGMRRHTWNGIALGGMPSIQLRPWRTWENTSFWSEDCQFMTLQLPLQSTSIKMSWSFFTVFDRKIHTTFR